MSQLSGLRWMHPQPGRILRTCTKSLPRTRTGTGRLVNESPPQTASPRYLLRILSIEIMEEFFVAILFTHCVGVLGGTLGWGCIIMQSVS